MLITKLAWHLNYSLKVTCSKNFVKSEAEAELDIIISPDYAKSEWNLIGPEPMEPRELIGPEPMEPRDQIGPEPPETKIDPEFILDDECQCRLLKNVPIHSDSTCGRLSTHRGSHQVLKT